MPISRPTISLAGPQNITMTKPDDRERILTQTRNLKMARSAHAYVRGSTVKFYDWLENSRPGELPEGPPVWICGDCHIGNLGPLADAKGHVLIQIRDLDQTVIGNPAHDLIRIDLSLASAARGSDLPGVTTAQILEELVAGYLAALTADFETDKDKSHHPNPFGCSWSNPHDADGDIWPRNGSTPSSRLFLWEGGFGH